MARIIAVANHKGGVGKTTSVANIGAALALMGKRTLLIDLDAQQNLTFCLMGNDGEEVEVSVYDSLLGKAPLPVVNIKKNLDLIPSSIDLARAELDLNTRLSREYIPKNLLKEVADKYDYILLDCPPSLGVITYNAFAAANDLFIALTAEALPLKGLTMLEDLVAQTQEFLNRELTISGVIITRYNNRKLNSAVVEDIAQRYGNRLFKTKVRENISVAEAPLEGKDIFEYAPDSNGAKDYRQVAEEIVERWG